MSLVITPDDRFLQGVDPSGPFILPDWVLPAKRTSPIVIAPRFHLAAGVHPGLGDAVACPTCVTRGGEARAGLLTARVISDPDGTFRWLCHECTNGYDSIDYVSWLLGENRYPRLTKAARNCVRRWFELLRWALPPSVPPTRAPPRGPDRVRFARYLR